MKKENGITLTSLVIYILVMMIVIGIMTRVSLNFYNNVGSLDSNSKDIVEFSNFNNYFVKEVKSVNNKVDSISNDGSYILFSDGNSFSLRNNKILYNNLEISKGVKSVKFEYYKDDENKERKDAITVNIEYENYTKKMNYKIESIY